VNCQQDVIFIEGMFEVVQDVLYLLLFFCGVPANSRIGRLVVEVSRWHAIRYTHTHTRYDSPVRMISPSKRPLPTQHTTNTTEEHSCH